LQQAPHRGANFVDTEGEEEEEEEEDKDKKYNSLTERHETAHKL